MVEQSHYYANLVQRVVDASVARTWAKAVLEWEIAGADEDPNLQSSCVCGHPELRHLYTIENTSNGNHLFPIGSVCIKKFERNDLSEEVTVLDRLFVLLHAVEEDQYVALDSNLFSRKLLRYLHDQGAFEANQYNGFDPARDYEFLLKMFNKRNKDDITRAQRKKIAAIVLGSIKPYLHGVLRARAW